MIIQKSLAGRLIQLVHTFNAESLIFDSLDFSYIRPVRLYMIPATDYFKVR